MRSNSESGSVEVDTGHQLARFGGPFQLVARRSRLFGGDSAAARLPRRPGGGCRRRQPFLRASHELVADVHRGSACIKAYVGMCVRAIAASVREQCPQEQRIELAAPRDDRRQRVEALDGLVLQSTHEKRVQLGRDSRADGGGGRHAPRQLVLEQSARGAPLVERPSGDELVGDARERVDVDRGARLLPPSSARAACSGVPSTVFACVAVSSETFFSSFASPKSIISPVPPA